MIYRDPAPVQCETCMKKKTRSPRMPMSHANKTFLKIITAGTVIGLVVAALVSAIDFVGQHADLANGRHAQFNGFEVGLVALIGFSVCFGIATLAAVINRATD